MVIIAKFETFEGLLQNSCVPIFVLTQLLYTIMYLPKNNGNIFLFILVSLKYEKVLRNNNI
jgi:hypothetical protein